jgi:CIC family chloride channel protein
LVGCIGFFLPQVLGQGYGWVQLAMAGSFSLGLVVLIALLKIVTTALTIGSGGSGGSFAPSVVIGGLLGTAVGMVFHHWLPNIAPSLPAFALVGMAGFLAGVAKTPLSGLIMVSEMTMGYGLLVPLMLTTATAYVLCPRRFSMYRSQVNARVDSPAHEGEFVNAMMEHMRVREAIPKDAKMIVFHRNTPLQEILDALADSKQQVFPVLNDDETLHGVIDFNDIRIFFTERGLPPRAVVAQDLLASTYAVVSLEEDLGSAMRKFRTSRLAELPVVEEPGLLHVVGVLSRRDVISAYHDRIYVSRPA